MRLFLCFIFSDGSGRSGTYILLDMVLNRINKGNSFGRLKCRLAFRSIVFFDFRCKGNRHRRHVGTFTRSAYEIRKDRRTIRICFDLRRRRSASYFESVAAIGRTIFYSDDGNKKRNKNENLKITRFFKN